MASLAPGNGWFPQRTDASRNSGYARRRRNVSAVSNVYAFPGIPNSLAATRRETDSGSAVAGRLAALLVSQSFKAGRTAGWVLGWCLFGIALAALVWLGIAGVLVAAALLIGVPWTTVAIAATLTHVLGATLAVLMGRRIGRSILRSIEKRKRLISEGA